MGRPGLIDRAIAAVSPHWALGRAKARARLDLIQRGYEGARPSSRHGGWIGEEGSNNAVIGSAQSALRARARDLVRNDPHARRALQLITALLVGTGFVGHSNTGDEALDSHVDALWERWATEADATGMTTLDGLVASLVSAMVVGGDGFLRRRPRRASDGLTIPIQLEVLTADYLAASDEGRGSDGLTYRQGVGFDGLGRRAAYLFHRAAPGEPDSVARGVTRVSADDVVHLFAADEPGQVRGVSWYAPVIRMLRDKGDYLEAALVKKRTESLFGVAITSPETGEGMPALSASTNAQTKQSDEFLVEELEPGLVMRLRPGEGLSAFVPSAVAGDLDSFMLHVLMAAGAGIGFGVTYDQITGDMRQANYSSLKASKNDQRRLVEQLQEFLIVPRIYERIRGWFIEEALMMGLIPLREGGYPFEWTPPAHEPIDAKAEQEADYFAMQTHRLTLKQYVEKWGYPFRQQIKDQAAAQAALKEAGLVLPSMPGAAAQPAPSA